MGNGRVKEKHELDDPSVGDSGRHARAFMRPQLISHSRALHTALGMQVLLGKVWNEVDGFRLQGSRRGCRGGWGEGSRTAGGAWVAGSCQREVPPGRPAASKRCRGPKSKQALALLSGSFAQASPAFLLAHSPLAVRSVSEPGAPSKRAIVRGSRFQAVGQHAANYFGILSYPARQKPGRRAFILQTEREQRGKRR